MALIDNLQSPIPVPTISAQLAEFTDPAAIAACNDPLRRVSMVMVGLSIAEGDSLTNEINDITQDTQSISTVNNLMRITNDASAKYNAAGPNDQVFYLKDLSDQDFDKLRGELIASGVDPTTLSKVLTLDNQPGSTAYDPTKPVGSYWGLATTKKAMDAASKNLQLHIDDLSSTAQQKQLFMQTLMGKFNGTFEVATAALRKLAEQNASTIRHYEK